MASHEHVVQNQIRLTLAAAPTLFRNNTALRDQNGRLVQFGLCGSGDLIGWPASKSHRRW